MRSERDQGAPSPPTDDCIDGEIEKYDVACVDPLEQRTPPGYRRER